MVKLQTSSMKKFENIAAAIRNKLINTKPTHMRIAVMLDSWVQRNFKTEGGNVGGWRELQAGGRFSGKGRQRKFDSNAKILQDTGRLRASFLPFATRANAGIGSDLDYAHAHEEGIGVPKRRMLMKLPEVRDDILKKYDAHVKESIK